MAWFARALVVQRVGREVARRRAWSYDRRVKSAIVSAALLLGASLAFAQSRVSDLATILGKPLQTPELVTYQLHESIYPNIPRLTVPATAQEWTAQAERIRRHLLDDVLFHGWPKEWVSSEPKFEDMGVIETGHGYRIRKLRYEIVPGFQSTALLYEPENASGKVPGILNLNGHDTVVGKASEYKQKRCINMAKHGIYALSLEWLGCGELNLPGNQHTYASALDVTGANGAGLFYLAMRRGLDYLDRHPNVDHARLAVTGLSGGGWQTIVLSSLDKRVLVAVPVAGYSGIMAKLEHRDDLGDNEQAPVDFLSGQEYTHLTAMRAPRPTMLIHNAEDDCCFRAGLVKPYTYDQIKPFFRLYGKEDVFGWHENMDPSTHNYQLDNRVQAYRFLSRNLGVPVIEEETPVDADVKSMEELKVGLPKDNLTIVGLARKMAASIQRAPASRERLKQVVRYEPIALEHAWSLANTKSRGVETMSWRFQFADRLSATGVSARAIVGAANRPVTIVLNDAGKKAAAGVVSDRVNRGEMAIAVDLVLHGDAAPQGRDVALYSGLLSSMGRRTLGIQAAQLSAIARWARERTGASSVSIDSTGKRNQMAALIAAALEPGLFAGVKVRDGMHSLQELLDKPVTFQEAPELFCLDLYKEFDVDGIAGLGPASK